MGFIFIGVKKKKRSRCVILFLKKKKHRQTSTNVEMGASMLKQLLSKRTVCVDCEIFRLLRYFVQEKSTISTEEKQEEKEERKMK